MDAALENIILRKRIAHLEKEVEMLRQLPPYQFSLSQFCATFLTNKFTPKTMPTASGIYAYYKPSTKELYIGQSVNMKRRLQQHFRRGKIVVSGHDAQFVDNNDWEFYVLEYIHKSKKSLLNDREAYWIALAKVAVSDKTIENKTALKETVSRLRKGQAVRGIQVTETVKADGTLTNATRGNNVRM